MVLENLRKRKGGFNGKTGIAKKGNIRAGGGDWGHEDVDCK